MRRLGARVAAMVGLVACGGSNGGDFGALVDGGASDAAIVNDAGNEASIDVGTDAASDAAIDVATDVDAGAVTKSDCSSANLTGCYRGMYVSLSTTGVGDITFGGATEQYADVLGDATKESTLLSFIKAHRIESLALYDLNTILADAALSADLLSFLARARAAGVTQVNAIGDDTLSAWDAIAAMQRSDAPFDGVVTEIEFWNPGTTFDQFTTTLTYIKSLAMLARSGSAMPVAAYIGWTTQAQIDATVPLLDRLYVHVYVTSADLAFGYGEQRFASIASSNSRLGTHVDVWPIFSAEGVMWSAGAEHFMGDWLSTHTLDDAESTLLTDWEATPPGATVHVTGFQYYADFFMEQYVK